MSFSVRSVLQDGIDWIQSSNSITLIAIFTGLFVGFEYLMSYASSSLISIGVSVSPAQFTVTGGTWLAIILGIIAVLIMIGASIVAIRIVTLEDDTIIPEESYRSGIGRAILSMIGAGVLFVLATMIGSVFLLIPGLFILISCFMYGFAVAVEGHGPIAALKHSWGLARGNRLRLLVLLVILFVLNGVLSMGPAYLGLDIIGTIGMSIGMIYSMAVVSSVYLELGGDRYEH